MPFCIYCGHQLADDAKFCSECGKSTNISNQPSQRKIVYDGEIHKCPNCGEIIKSFVSDCPACGFEFRGLNSVDSVKEFAAKLGKISSDSDMVNLIRTFPIPNSKEDIYEFMILASTNISETLSPIVEEAWNVKVEQCFQKAKIVLNNEKELFFIQEMYDKAITKVKYNKNIHYNKIRKNKHSQLFSVFPNIIIVTGWIISILILIPLCNVNLDNVGTNSFQLLLIFNFIAGANLIPYALKCKSAIPKVILSLGLILSVIILIPFCTTNLDNVGTNAFQLIFIVDIVCSIIILVKMFKQK